MKILSPVVFALFALMCAGRAQQTSGPWTYTVSDNAVTITRYSGFSPSTTLTVPSDFNGYPVKVIGDGAESVFSSGYGFSSVVVPDGVTSISAWAFANSSDVKSVVMPDSVVRIDYGAFYWCFSLNNLVLSSSLTDIGDYAFSGCQSLAAIAIPRTVARIGSHVFDYCYKLTNIDVDSGNALYASVDGVLFNKALTALISYPSGRQGAYSIPEGVNVIKRNAFPWTEGLTEVTIASTVLDIESDYSVFQSCPNLTQINVDAGNPMYASIDGVLFNKAITTLMVYPDGRSGPYTIPSGVVTVGAYAFSGSRLTAVSIPNSVTSIESDAFSYSRALTSVSIPDSVTNIGSSAFAGCESVGSITIGNGVTTIGAYAFQSCTNLAEIMIPRSVTSIGDSAFDRCYKLDNINVVSDNQTFASLDGVLFDKAFTSILDYPDSRRGTYVIPSSVTSIGKSAFSSSLLTTVVMPDGLTSIGEQSFIFAERLLSVSIPSSVTGLGWGAFRYCTSLSSVIFFGNAPLIVPNYYGGIVFEGCPTALQIFYLSGASGWGPSYAGRSTIVSPFGEHFLEGGAAKAPFDVTQVGRWTFGGSSWIFDAAVSSDGSDSIRATTTDNLSTYREYVVAGPAVIDFWWKVSSEELYDTFSYSINSTPQETISGEVDWTYRTFTLPEGNHTIRWTYSKDGSGGVGSDAGWLDEFAVYPATAALRVKDGPTVLTGGVQVDFGSGGGQNAVTKSLTFENTSYLPLDAELSLPDDSPFTFADGSRDLFISLGRLESTNVTITLEVSETGQKAALLTIFAPNSETAPPSIRLTGTVVGGDMRVVYNSADIISGQAAAVEMGIAPCEVEFTITNNGNVADLVISEIAASGNFHISQLPSRNVAVGASTTFKVLATDLQQGAQQGTISISSNDEDTPVFTFPVASRALLGVGAGVSTGSVSTSGFGWPSVGWDFANTSLPNGNTGSALKTGATGHGGQSQLQATFAQAGLLSWKWKVSTQERSDWLACEVNGSEVLAVSTKNAVWGQQVVHVPSNAVVKWVYRKDASGTIGEDAGHLADISFQPFTSPPITYSNWWASFGRPSAPPVASLMPRSSLPAVFSWVGGFNPDSVPDAGHYRQLIEGGQPKFRFPISKAYSGGSVSVQFSSGLTNGWSGAGVTQVLHSQDSQRVIIEATPPAGATKGFMRLNVR
jgi:hypothetical protein